eukprot:4727196-Pyramimonas_sp.AAC.1
MARVVRAPRSRPRQRAFLGGVEEGLDLIGGPLREGGVVRDSGLARPSRFEQQEVDFLRRGDARAEVGAAALI